EQVARAATGGRARPQPGGGPALPELHGDDAARARAQRDDRGGDGRQPDPAARREGGGHGAARAGGVGRIDRQVADAGRAGGTADEGGSGGPDRLPAGGGGVKARHATEGVPYTGATARRAMLGTAGTPR